MGVGNPREGGGHTALGKLVKQVVELFWPSCSGLSVLGRKSNSHENNAEKEKEKRRELLRSLSFRSPNLPSPSGGRLSFLLSLLTDVSRHPSYPSVNHLTAHAGPPRWAAALRSRRRPLGSRNEECALRRQLKQRNKTAPRCHVYSPREH